MTSDPDDDLDHDDLGGDGDGDLFLASVADVTDSEVEDRREDKGQTVWLIVFFIVCGLCAVVAVAGYHMAESHYRDRALPGVTFAGASVSGKTSSELTALVKRTAASTGLRLTDSKGKTVKASLGNLGVTVNVDSTVKALLAAKRDESPFVWYLPFWRQSVGLKSSTTETTLTDYLTRRFVAKANRPKASTISYDKSVKAFVVNGGTPGTVPQTEVIKDAIDEVADDPGTFLSVSFRYETGEMPVSIEEATKVAAKANSRLSLSLKITGNGHELKVDGSTIAAWTTTTQNLKKGTIDITYDEDLIKAYLDKQLPAKIGKTLVNEKDIVDGDGKKVMVDVVGVDGVTVTNADDLAQSLHDALSSGQSATLQATTSTTKHGVTTVVVDVRIVVDLSKQTLTVYKGSTKAAQFLVSVGKSAVVSTSDKSYVTKTAKSANITVSSGSASSGSSSPNGSSSSSGSSKSTAKGTWVTYFGSSQAFLSASWSDDGIAKGNPSSSPSSPFVDMYESDAQWVYTNCPKGTRVQFTGSVPSSSVR